MINILSWNINGYRSLLQKGVLFDILANNYDIICFQEVKLLDLNIVEQTIPISYHIYGNISSNGRNGVVVLSKKEANTIGYTIGHTEFDKQGRYIRIEYPEFTLINLYMPHGGRDKSKLPYKIEVATAIENVLKSIVCENVIIATDLNIARDDIDVCRAKFNYNNIMFTASERNILQKYLQTGYKDAYRELYPLNQAFTWWSYAFECRKRNIGWRIDYFLVSSVMMSLVKDVRILKEQMGSDHCPIVMELRD